MPTIRSTGAAGVVASLLAIALFVGSVRFGLREPAGDALDALGDFLGADAKVWHLLLTVGASGAVTFAFRARRRQAPQTETSETDDTFWSYCPPEIEHANVLWPIKTDHNGYEATGFKVGKPMCPKCRSTLDWLTSTFDFAKDADVERITALPESWAKLTARDMRFECPKDKSRYDLTEHGREMADTMKAVEGRAWGEYRSAEAAATAKRKR